MCCDRIASPSLTRQNVHFSSPPAASMSGAVAKPGGSGMAAGAKPRPRRSTRGDPSIERDDRIVEPDRDGAIVHQREIGDGAQSCERLIVVDDLRLIREVAAGHHDGAVDARSRSRCSGVVGSMKPSVVRPGATTSGSCSPAARSSTIGASGRPAAAPRGCTSAIAADDVEIARHHRERLRVAVLAGAQPRHGAGIGRVAGELIAAQPLHRQDVTAQQQGACGVESSSDGTTRRRRGGRDAAGAAGVAGDGLGVKAPVGRILVLATAVVAQRERAIVVAARS